MGQSLYEISRQLAEQPAWTAFGRATAHVDYDNPTTQASIESAMNIFGLSRAEVIVQFEEAKSDEIFLNSRYQVNRRRKDPPAVLKGLEPAIIHLSIKRLDKGTFIPWRDKQRIKNELVGAEYEGVELYPAESRLVDTSNQFHMWIIAEPGYQFPFGFQERFVTEETLGASVQAPFEK